MNIYITILMTLVTVYLIIKGLKPPGGAPKGAADLHQEGPVLPLEGRRELRRLELRARGEHLHLNKN